MVPPCVGKHNPFEHPAKLDIVREVWQSFGWEVYRIGLF